MAENNLQGGDVASPTTPTPATPAPNPQPAKTPDVRAPGDSPMPDKAGQPDISEPKKS
jgi:hypothetical protein